MYSYKIVFKVLDLYNQFYTLEDLKCQFYSTEKILKVCPLQSV